MDLSVDNEVAVAPPAEEVESASPVSEESEVEERPVRPINSMKLDGLRRLKALERRGKTVGTHLDELRALLTDLFELLPD